MKKKTIDSRFDGYDFDAATKAYGYDYVDRVAELYNFYTGNHKTHMEGSTGYLQKHFPNAYDNGKGTMASLSVPFLKRLVDISATLFHRKPRWILTRNGEELRSDDVAYTIFKNIEKQTNLAFKLKQAQRFTRLFKTVFVQPAWRSGRLSIDVLAPNIVQVAEDPADPTNLATARQIAVSTTSGYMLWEQKEAAFLGKDDLVYNALFPDGQNGYGLLPFVHFNDDTISNGIFAPLDDSMLEGQIALNLLWSLYRFQMSVGFGINVLYTQADIKSDDLPFGADRILKLTDKTMEGFDRVSAGLDIAGMLKFAESLLKTYGTLNGVHPDVFSISGESFSNALTGVAKAMDRLDLQEIREDQEIYWESKISSLFDVLRVVWNYHNAPVDRLPADVELSVSWADEPEGMHNILQEAQAQQMKLESGLVTKEELLAEKKNISEAEAKESLES